MANGIPEQYDVPFNPTDQVVRDCSKRIGKARYRFLAMPEAGSSRNEFPSGRSTAHRHCQRLTDGLHRQSEFGGAKRPTDDLVPGHERQGRSVRSHQEEVLRRSSRGNTSHKGANYNTKGWKYPHFDVSSNESCDSGEL